MTIKEVEARTGLTRANIRYYEGEGFFSADRGENGYRNYSEENIDILLKVKLLRQLGFSLEDIHALQAGEQSLGSALARREEGLGREQAELDRAAQLCRDMRTDGVDFRTLDAQRYLNRLAREEDVLSKDRDPMRLFPWRRYFARTLDLELYIALLTVVLQIICRINVVRMRESGGTVLLTLAALVLMAGAETAMLHLWGTTPGKALLGLKVLREDGSFLSWEEAARRTGLVMAFFGGGLLLAQIPIPICALVSLGMDIWACWRVYHGKPLFWEGDQLYLDGSTRERAFWENSRNYLRVAAYLAVFAACIGLMVGGHLLAARPPHRGLNLTVEEFVENYNRFMDFTYGEDNLSRYLTVNGTFAEKEQSGNVIVTDAFGDSPVPEETFRFREEQSRLTEVTLTRKYESGMPLGDGETYSVYIPYDDIYAAMRAFLYSQLGEKKIDSLYDELTAANGSLHCVLDTVRINGEMKFFGYYDFGETTLFAESGQKQSYFVEFTMELTD